MSTSDDAGCPICGPGNCPAGYPHLWRRLREDPSRWRTVHDQVNGPAPMDPPPTPEDLALRAFAAEGGGCCGGGPDHTSTEEMT